MGALRVECTGLGKRYLLGEGSRYGSLRDSIAVGVSSIFGRIRGAAPAASSASHIWALRDVEFSAGKGEVVGIIGRNGAGKSTLLRILAGVTEPTVGRAATRGRIGSLLGVGTGFHPELTGRENVFVSGSILGLSRREIMRRFDEIVAFADVERFLDTPLKRYSSGMAVRLGFAVAAHLETDVLLADEVLAVGDAAFQQKCISTLGRLEGSDRTILFISHDLAAVQRLCSRTILLERGRVVAEGATPQVVATYLSTGASRTELGEAIDVRAATREGSGEVRVSSLVFRSTDPGGALHVTSNGGLEVIAHLTCAHPIQAGAINLFIRDQKGTLLLDLDSALLGKQITFVPGENVIRFRVESLPLNPGTYYSGIYIARQAHSGTIDYIDPVAPLEISPSDTSRLYGYTTARGPVSTRFSVERIDPVSTR
jgi:lipopolysaccharide transport system ATP-binding protein